MDLGWFGLYQSLSKLLLGVCTWFLEMVIAGQGFECKAVDDVRVPLLLCALPICDCQT